MAQLGSFWRFRLVDGSCDDVLSSFVVAEFDGGMNGGRLRETRRLLLVGTDLVRKEPQREGKDDRIEILHDTLMRYMREEKEFKRGGRWL